MVDDPRKFCVRSKQILIGFLLFLSTMGCGCSKRKKPFVRNCDVKYENTKVQTATFGMQCYWNAESRLGCTAGVVRTRVGYSGGTTENPTSQDKGDHIEVVEIEFDPNKTTFINLLDTFWKNNDTINQQPIYYQSTIFYHNPEQRRAAQESLQEQADLRKEPVLTRIIPAGTFYMAASEHQKYFLQLDTFLMSELRFDSTELIRSHIATRLNGYIARTGDIEMFDNESEDLELPLNVVEYVRKLLTSG